MSIEKRKFFLSVFRLFFALNSLSMPHLFFLCSVYTILVREWETSEWKWMRRKILLSSSSSMGWEEVRLQCGGFLSKKSSFSIFVKFRKHFPVCHCVCVFMWERLAWKICVVSVLRKGKTCFSNAESHNRELRLCWSSSLCFYLHDHPSSPFLTRSIFFLLQHFVYTHNSPLILHANVTHLN